MRKSALLAERKPIKITVIYTHVNPHGDDLCAIDALRRFGRKIFPGIETAQIVYIADSNFPEHDEDWYLARGILPVGLWGGTFDDHYQSEADKGKSAYNLVADFLNVSNVQKVRLLVEYINRSDKLAATTPLDVAQVINIINLLTELNAAEIERWLRQALDCYYNDRVVVSREPQDDHLVWPIQDSQYRLIKPFYQRWLTENELGDFEAVGNNPELQQLTKFVHQLDTGGPCRLFNVAEFTALIIACYGGDQAAIDLAYAWLKPVFDAKWAEQQEFVKATGIVQSTKVQFLPKCGSLRDSCSFLVIKDDDNPCLIKAARRLNPKPDLLIIRQTNGHVLMPNLNPDSTILFPIVRAVRLAEQICLGRRGKDLVFSFKELSKPEALPNIPYWYFFINNQGQIVGLYNGTWSRTDVQATAIPFQKMLYIISKMLSSDCTVDSWPNFCQWCFGELRDVAA